jgi:hypothetical protein
MAILVENTLNEIQMAGGINTQKPVVLSGTAATLAVGGTLAVTGASAFTGVATFTAAPVFTAAPTGQQKVAVTASGGAARTLTAANSGSINLFDAATSISYTLPAPVVGLYYDFLWTALETGGQAHVIITDAGTTFVGGYITMFSDVNVTPSATLGPKGFNGDASTHIKVTMNGTTTGGGIGTLLRATCISTTVWNISGTVRSPSGTIATPFST